MFPCKISWRGFTVVDSSNHFFLNLHTENKNTFKREWTKQILLIRVYLWYQWRFELRIYVFVFYCFILIKLVNSRQIYNRLKNYLLALWLMHNGIIWTCIRKTAVKFHSQNCENLWIYCVLTLFFMNLLHFAAEQNLKLCKIFFWSVDSP